MIVLSQKEDKFDFDFYCQNRTYFFILQKLPT